MTELQWLAKKLTKEGWDIVVLSDDTLVVSRKGEPNGCLVLLGILGLLFFLIPGIILLALAYSGRGTQTVTYTLAEAKQEWSVEKARSEIERIKQAEMNEQKAVRQAGRINWKKEHGFLGNLFGNWEEVLFAAVLVGIAIFIGVMWMLG